MRASFQISSPDGLTAFVLATTTDLGDVSLLRFLAVFTTILAVLFRRTVASGMGTFTYLIICHEIHPF